MLLLDDPAHAFVPYPPVPVPHAPTGPLAGLSLGVKDLFDVAGYPTGGGNPLVLAMSGVRREHAPAVQALLDAGARFVGKTHTDELAFSMNGKNAHFGTPRNGGAPDRIPGGSSSGSASAVSNRLCDIALGTDTGGSVRAPASHCGLYGLRPTHGRISLARTMDLSPSFDTCGFFARDASTFARAASVLLGADPSPLPASPRLLCPADAWALIEPAPAAALSVALERVEAVLGAATACRLPEPGLDEAYTHYRVIQGREAWAVDGGFIERYAPPLGPGVKERFEWARALGDDEVARGIAFRERFRAAMHALLGDDGVLVVPTMPDIAPLLTTSEASLDTYRQVALRLLCVAGLAGLPQLSLPLARRDGAPLGLSLIGPAGADRSLVAIAETIAT
jgi:amidase